VRREGDAESSARNFSIAAGRGGGGGGGGNVRRVGDRAGRAREISGQVFSRPGAKKVSRDPKDVLSPGGGTKSSSGMEEREREREELFFPAHTAGDEMPYIKFSSSGT